VVSQGGHPLRGEAVWSPALEKQHGESKGKYAWLCTKRQVRLPGAGLAVETISVNLSAWGHGALARGKQGDRCGQTVTATALEKQT